MLEERHWVSHYSTKALWARVALPRVTQAVAFRRNARVTVTTDCRSALPAGDYRDYGLSHHSNPPHILRLFPYFSFPTLTRLLSSFPTFIISLSPLPFCKFELEHNRGKVTGSPNETSVNCVTRQSCDIIYVDKGHWHERRGCSALYSFLYPFCALLIRSATVGDESPGAGPSCSRSVVLIAGT